MTELLSEHGLALRASVSDALREISDLSALLDAIAFVRTTVNIAIADMAHMWNSQHKDTLRRLPLEVHVSCLSWLEGKHLIAASHVSRHWRAIALSEPSLWVFFDGMSFRDPDDALEAALFRSRSAPFDLIWDARFAMLPRVCEMLVNNASRLRSLEISECAPDELTLGLFGRPMPLLHTLVAYSEDELQLPDSLSDETLPRLRSLTLGEVLLPKRIQAVTSVTSLALVAPPDCRDLFQLFPRVQDVTLWNVLSTSRLPHVLAPTITSFKLRFDTGYGQTQPQDHSLFLQNSEWHLVSDMRLESSSVSRPLRWFTARTGAAWRTKIAVRTIYHRTQMVDMELEAEEGAMRVCIPRPDFLADATSWTASVTTLSLHGIKDLLALLPGCTFPSLQSLTLHAHEVHPLSNYRIEPLVVPLLQVFVLDFGTVHQGHVLKARKCIEVVPDVLFLRERRLPTARLVGGVDILQLQWDDLSAAWEFCDTVWVEDVESKEVRVFSTVEAECGGEGGDQEKRSVGERAA